MAFKYKIELRGGSSVIETVNASDLNTAVSTAVFNTNDLTAEVVGGNINITNQATEELVLSNIPHADLLQYNNTSWGSTASDVKEAINAFLKGSGHTISNIIDVDSDLTGTAGHGLVFDSLGKKLILSSSPLLNTSYSPPPPTETDPVFTASPAYSITNTNKSNWNTAYGWGDHSTAGYVPETRTLTINGTTFDLSANRTWTLATTTLASLTDTSISNPVLGEILKYNGSAWENWAPNYLTAETDPVYTASSWYTTTNNSANWDTAYGWGDHSTAGYLSNISTNATTSDVFTILTNSIFAGVDAGATKLVYWDDSNSKLTHLALGTNLSITGGTLNASVGSHTHTASEITDFDAEVSNNTDVAANTAKVGYTDAAVDARIGAASISDLSDVPDIGTAGQVLVVNAGATALEYANQTGGGASAIDDLTDVDTSTTAPSTNDTLVWDGTNWVPGTVSGTGSPWTTSGNDIYYTTGNVGIGTATPGEALDVSGKVNINDGSNNVLISTGNSTITATNTVAVGYQALTALTTGFGNTAVGYQASDAVTEAGQNTSLGYRALSGATTGGHNVALGYHALLVANGTNNVAIGSGAGDSVTSGSANIIIGRNAGSKITTGQGNTFQGFASGQYTTGLNNTMIGRSAGLGSDGASNYEYAVGIGYQAFKSLTTGDDGVAIGRDAAASVTSAAGVVAIGSSALTALTTGAGNTAVGYQASDAMTVSAYTTALGHQALSSVNAADTTADGSTAVGYQALTALTTGAGNTALGYQAGNAITTGVDNTLIGHQTGSGITTGQNNIEVGKNNKATNASHRVSVGYLTGGGNESVSIGDGAGKNATGTKLHAIGRNAAANGYTGVHAIAIGYEAGANMGAGSYNIYIGHRQGKASPNSANNVSLGNNAQTIGNNNVIIGHQAGQSLTTASDGNVLIGYEAGNAETGSNKLYIENSNSTTPLIYGEFDNDLIRINGDLEVKGTNTSGTLFSVNDVSGLPKLEVDDTEGVIAKSIKVDDGALTTAGQYGKGAEIWYQGTSTPTAGSVYYLNSSGDWSNTDASAVATAKGMLSVSVGTDSDVDGMVIKGFVYVGTDPGGSVGDVVYLSETANQLTTTAPTTASAVVRVCGYKVGTNIVYFDPSKDWIELS